VYIYFHTQAETLCIFIFESTLSHYLADIFPACAGDEIALKMFHAQDTPLLPPVLKATGVSTFQWCLLRSHSFYQFDCA